MMGARNVIQLTDYREPDDTANDPAWQTAICCIALVLALGTAFVLWLKVIEWGLKW